MRSLYRAFLAIALAGAFTPAGAEIYRCTDPAGNVEYRDSSCMGAVASRKLDIAPVASDSAAEANRARIARESAEFNERFDRQMAARAALQTAYYYYSAAYPGQILAAQNEDPHYYAYAGTALPRERMQRPRFPIKAKPVRTVPAPKSPLMKR